MNKWKNGLYLVLFAAPLVVVYLSHSLYIFTLTTCLGAYYVMFSLSLYTYLEKDKERQEEALRKDNVQLKVGDRYLIKEFLIRGAVLKEIKISKVSPSGERFKADDSWLEVQSCIFVEKLED